jgi:DNA-binding beta-propeller fold protein YncE
MKKLHILLMLASLVMLASCESNTEVINDPTPIFGKRLLILNEGGFGKGNSSLDAWSYRDTTKAENIAPGLGDTGNDIKLIDDNIYIVMNESNKIWVLTADSVKVINTITFESDFDPTAIAKTADGEAMVPLLHRDSVAVIDTKTNTIKSFIPAQTSGRGIGVLGGNAYIANDSGGVTIINTTTKAVSYVNNIIVNPYDVEVDSVNGKVILVGIGDFVTFAPPEMIWFDPVTKTVSTKITFTANDYFLSNFGGFIGNDKFYLTFGDRVAVADLASRSVTNNSFIAKGYYCGTYDKNADQLIFGDAKDFTNNGSVDFYNKTTGAITRTLTAGVIPAHFLIYTK